jgi:glycosyltransferase involved in cell wall biosynthesis
VVLASDGGGLPDALGTAGLLFRRGDLADLQGQLGRLLSDSSLREHLRDRATGHLRAFQQEVVCNRYLSILEKAGA